MNWGDGADALATIDGGMFWVMILYFYIAFCSVLLQVGFKIWFCHVLSRLEAIDVVVS